MRFYIVDKNGTVWGDFDNEYKAQLTLDSVYTQEQIKENELEIIEGR